MQKILIAGGGIGGLAAALACSRTGHEVALLERTNVFAEVGAGIQLGPNVIRRLRHWGLMAELQAVAHQPEAILIKDAVDGQLLARKKLAQMVERYDAPYWTMHRADLHRVLWNAIQAEGVVECQCGSTVLGYEAEGAEEIRLRFLPSSPTPAAQTASSSRLTTDPEPRTLLGRLLVGADGARSVIRGQLLADGPPVYTGHLAYRALLRQSELPASLRQSDVTVWLAPGLHAVIYPVSGGQELNVVVLVEGPVPEGPIGWDHPASMPTLMQALQGLATPLQDLVRAVLQWRLWPLFNRPPVQRASHMGQGLVALVGDAAHPTLPYLAQGAGMAIEDAYEISRQIAQIVGRDSKGWTRAVTHYSVSRYARSGRVQEQSARNGGIFHAQGLLRWSRNKALQWQGERLLRNDWLYAG